MILRSPPLLIIAAVSALIVPAAAFGSGRALRSRAHGSNGFYVYDYSKGGQDWAMGSCASRTRQSPINFLQEWSTAAPSANFSFLYSKVVEPFTYANTGQCFAAELGGKGYGGLTYENAWYNLLSLNVHVQSEHTFAGAHRAAELHLVHKRYDGDAILVVAVPLDVNSSAPPSFAQESDHASHSRPRSASLLGLKQPVPAGLAPDPAEGGWNAVLQTLIKVDLPAANKRIQVPLDPSDPLDLNTLLQNGTFYEYAGSLTAPPCAEIVTWLVRREPLAASATQLHILRAAVLNITGGHGNARNVMPLSGRTVAVRKAFQEPAIVRITDPEGFIPVEPMPDRELRAAKLAKQAMAVAQSSVDYVRELDNRIRAAAQPATTLAGTASTTPGPRAGTTPAGPDALEALARVMAASVQQAAGSAVSSAAQQLTEAARAAAMAAARDATAAVLGAMATTTAPF